MKAMLRWGWQDRRVKHSNRYVNQSKRIRMGDDEVYRIHRGELKK